MDVFKPGKLPTPPRIYAGRYVPKDKSLSERLKALCDRKVSKLAPYKEAGLTTILLLETDDIASMNESILCDAVREAYPAELPPGVEELWYADTAGQPQQLLFYDVSGDLDASALR